MYIQRNFPDSTKKAGVKLTNLNIRKENSSVVSVLYT